MMDSILYQNLNPKAEVKSKLYPNTPAGLETLAELILEMHYRPWWKMKNQKTPTGFEWFFFNWTRKMGLDFLKHDEEFFHYKLTLVQ